MAHNISMVGGKAAVAYLGSVPWHGLGTEVNADQTADEMLIAAGLNWQVEKRNIPGSVIGAQELVRLARPNYDEVDIQLGRCTKAYHPLQNDEAFKIFDMIAGVDKATFHTAGALGDGETIWVLAKLPDTIKVKGDDIVDKFMLLSNTHNGSEAISVKFTPIRVVCHAKGTPIIDGDWRGLVENHPSVTNTKKCEGREISVRGLPFTERVTPEHRYWARQLKRTVIPKKNNELEQANNGKIGQNIDANWVYAENLLPVSHEIGYPIDMVEKPVPDIPVATIIRSGGTRKNRNDSTVKTEWETKQEPRLLDENWWWLIGYWWGNGHIHAGRNGKSGIVLSIPNSKPNILNRIIELLKTSGWSGKPVERVGCSQITFYDKTLSNFLSNWKSEGSAQKTPPAWIENISLTLQKSLIQGYYSADGNTDTTEGCIISSVSLNGLLCLRRILLRLGIPSSIRKSSIAGKGKICGRNVDLQSSYSIRFWVNVEQLGYETRFKGNFSHPYIENGWLWSRVESVSVIEDEFVPITTETHDYVTSFGRSHNCQNTLSMAMSDGNTSIRIRHTANMEYKLASLPSLFGITNTEFDEVAEVYKAMANKQINTAGLNKFLDALMPMTTTQLQKNTVSNKIPTRWEAIIQDFENPEFAESRGTLWSLYNSLTRFVDYAENVKSKDTTSRLKRVWFGAGADLKIKALEVAKQLLVA